MKIVACVKQVPDSAARVIVDNGKVSWGEAPLVINPWDEFAMEAALRMKEAHGGTVTAVTIGNEGTKDALKHALAMGADDAILINDPALDNLDPQAIAQILKATIQKIGSVDMVFFGRQAIDGDSGIVPTQTARLLGWPSIILAAAIQLESGNLRVERSIEEGRQIVNAKLPAVLSVAKDYGEPRYPSFMGIRKAQRAEIPTWSLSDLGIPAPAPMITWPEVMNLPARDVTCEMLSGSPEEIADALVDKLLAEKVL